MLLIRGYSLKGHIAKLNFKYLLNIGNFVFVTVLLDHELVYSHLKERI